MITDLSSPSSCSSILHSSLHKTNGQSSLKLPYPILSDHRDLSSILNLLQKETQTTSKKITDIIKHINEYEQRLTSHLFNDTIKKYSKIKCIKFKQQLNTLKKHERRVSLQIDFITIKNEIKGLEDKQKCNKDQQIKILLGKLNQKLDKMKIYMQTRNEQMKKFYNKKNEKHSKFSTNHTDLNKRLKSTVPVIRLTSRITGDNSKKCSIQSSIDNINNKIIERNKLKLNNKRSLDDDDELDFEINIDELFNDDSYAE